MANIISSAERTQKDMVDNTIVGFISETQVIISYTTIVEVVELDEAEVTFSRNWYLDFEHDDIEKALYGRIYPFKDANLFMRQINLFPLKRLIRHVLHHLFIPRLGSREYVYQMDRFNLFYISQGEKVNLHALIILHWRDCLRIRDRNFAPLKPYEGNTLRLHPLPAVIVTLLPTIRHHILVEIYSLGKSVTAKHLVEHNGEHKNTINVVLTFMHHDSQGSQVLYPSTLINYDNMLVVDSLELSQLSLIGDAKSSILFDHLVRSFIKEIHHGGIKLSLPSIFFSLPFHLPPPPPSPQPSPSTLPPSSSLALPRPPSRFALPDRILPRLSLRPPFSYQTTNHPWLTLLPSPPPPPRHPLSSPTHYSTPFSTPPHLMRHPHPFSPSPTLCVAISSSPFTLRAIPSSSSFACLSSRSHQAKIDTKVLKSVLRMKGALWIAFQICKTHTFNEGARKCFNDEMCSMDRRCFMDYGRSMDRRCSKEETMDHCFAIFFFQKEKKNICDMMMSVRVRT
ncbi:hypothetical protein Fmac_029137 [Flemingia macrophylla]|uniref:Uncharacterized protein n=1 Tax=Flemingia macrophylla TaxID=520843 RepID=A0ABD1L9U4_9FABA